MPTDCEYRGMVRLVYSQALQNFLLQKRLEVTAPIITKLLLYSKTAEEVCN
jgi:hypothetical protein